MSDNKPNIINVSLCTLKMNPGFQSTEPLCTLYVACLQLQHIEVPNNDSILTSMWRHSRHMRLNRPVDCCTDFYSHSCHVLNFADQSRRTMTHYELNYRWDEYINVGWPIRKWKISENKWLYCYYALHPHILLYCGYFLKYITTEAALEISWCIVMSSMFDLISIEDSRMGPQIAGTSSTTAFFKC